MESEIGTIVKIINSSHLPNSSSFSQKEVLSLFSTSAKNKIGLLFLESALKFCPCTDCSHVKKVYDSLKKHEKVFLSEIESIAKIFSKQNIQYVLFKTLRQYSFIASDIDLLFFNKGELEDAQHSLEELGYNGQFDVCGITMVNPKNGIKIDLHNEIAVSRLIYFDKSKIRNYVTTTEFGDAKISSLTPELELLITIGHSLFKEQLYTLTDFYTQVIRLEQFTPNQVENFMELIIKFHMEFPCKTVMRMTRALCRSVFKADHERAFTRLKELERRIKIDTWLYTTAERELRNFTKRKVKLPYRYGLRTIASAFAAKIIHDGTTRNSMVEQLKKMLSSYSFSKDFFSEFAAHMRHETY